MFAIFMTCCIVVGLLPSGPPLALLSLWPAELTWALYPSDFFRMDLFPQVRVFRNMVIEDISFITFLKSGRGDVRMVSFGRDMQKPAEISHTILEVEFCSDTVLQ